MRPMNPLWVLVGNSHELECHHLCEVVTVHVKSLTFSVNLHVLLLCGAYLVLGVQWLKSLGLILTNYNDLTMKFL